MAVTTDVESNERPLVRVFKGLIGALATDVCDARELHVFLQNGKQFADWIKQRIDQYQFEPDRDFHCFSLRSEKPRGGRPSTEYHLTLDMAKELSMVENNENGRQARRYFISKEREAIAAAASGLSELDFNRLLETGRWLLSANGRGGFSLHPLAVTDRILGQDDLRALLEGAVKIREGQQHLMRWVDDRGLGYALDVNNSVTPRT